VQEASSKEWRPGGSNQANPGSTRLSFRPTAAATRPDELPLSFAQERMLFATHMKGVNEGYHIRFVHLLSGHLDRSALLRALNAIQGRHEVLRSSFTLVRGQAVQRITPQEDVQFELIEHDLRQDPDASAQLKRLVTAESGTPFNLESGPPIRGRLIQLAEDRHALLITMHHIVSDGWSIGLLAKELNVLYGAFLNDETDPLPRVEIQYADYSLWQRREIEVDVLRRQAAYWKEALGGVPSLLGLPTDFARPSQQNFTGGFAAVILDDKLTAGLRSLSRRQGTTLFMTLLAGWATLLARLSAEQDVVVGIPVANRGRKEIEDMIGLFVNTVALRLNVSSSTTVKTLLQQTRERVLSALEHQDIPFEQVVEVINPIRSLAHSPIFQAMFAWQTEGDPLRLPGLDSTPVELPHNVAKFDLTLSIRESGEGIQGRIQYATSLFKEATIQRYISYLHNVLRAMIADDSESVWRLPLIDERECRQALYDWNDTQTPLPSNECVHRLFEKQAIKNANATAVISGNKSISYEALNRRANQLAYYLRLIGVTLDARVAICVERSVEMIVAILAVLKAGGAYVPLDPDNPPERLQFMLEDCNPVALITQKGINNRSVIVDRVARVIDITGENSLWDEFPETNLDVYEPGLTAKHLAYVIYTSGSSGTPKGVMVEHQNLCNYLQWSRQAYFQQPGNGAPVVHSIGFDGVITTLFGPLLEGQTLTLLPRGSEMDCLARLCSSGGDPYTLIKVTPSHLRLLNELIASDGNHAPTLTLMIGGEALIPLDVLFWQKRFPQVRIVNHFGPTETTVGCCTFEITGPAGGMRSIPIGRPIANTRIYILDAQKQPVPAGVPGELYVGGAGVARGYLNQPGLTAQRFLPDPFIADGEARMYKTGDLGKWLDDGTIEFLGRNDYQVKIRGFRVELGEVEARMAEYPGVREAVAVVLEDTTGNAQLVAYYTGSEEGVQNGERAIRPEDLRAELARKLPEHMLPGAYVRIGKMPLSVNGKLDRKALPVPESDSYARQVYEAPEGELEEVLASIWEEVLKIEKVGRRDNFFSLGGHSLLTLRLATQLERKGINISAVDLFKHATIESLAESLTAQSEFQKKGTPTDRAICFRAVSKEPPLFLTYDGSGQLIYVPMLAPYMDPSIPLYGLPATPPYESQLRTIEEMSARMVQLIRAIQPEGPYRIGGWSFGGLTAYEIAVQLSAAKQELDFVGLLDTYYTVPTRNYTDIRTEFCEKRELLNKIQMIMRHLQATDAQRTQVAAELESVAAANDFEGLVNKCREFGLLPSRWIDLTAVQLAQSLARMHSHELAAMRYAPPEIAVNLHLFLAEEDARTSTSLGWDQVMSGARIYAVKVPGTHLTIMEKPNIASLGQALSNAIRYRSAIAAQLTTGEIA
jgi:amino acid adenylation domain-containing protein